MSGLVRTGVADLRLHGGSAPDWLVRRMIVLARAFLDVFIDEFGARKFLVRLSDPLWFHAFSCVLGYDWDSSGTTTVTCGVLKTTIDPAKHGMFICGGKGKKSVQTQREMETNIPRTFDFSEEDIAHLKYSSRMAAKVDNAAIQDGYHLYHHTFLVTEERRWAVIQQGMNSETRLVRRYHWLSDNVKCFVNEPHASIVCARDHGDGVLDMTSAASENCRETCTEMVNEGLGRIARAYSEISSYRERGAKLDEWMTSESKANAQHVTHYKLMPKKMNWDLMKKVYDIHPQDYEQLIGIRGVGASTVRGLALISELLYGESPSWKDPVKFTFAFGGKDGVPFPVDRKAMDEATQILEHAIGKARVGEKERINSIKRLRRFASGQSL